MLARLHGCWGANEQEECGPDDENGRRADCVQEINDSALEDALQAVT
jgi:hypothetical protein